MFFNLLVWLNPLAVCFSYCAVSLLLGCLQRAVKVQVMSVHVDSPLHLSFTNLCFNMIHLYCLVLF